MVVHVQSPMAEAPSISMADSRAPAATAILIGHFFASKSSMQRWAGAHGDRNQRRSRSPRAAPSSLVLCCHADRRVHLDGGLRRVRLGAIGIGAAAAP
eukprot:342587-Chlamydomonas_euryale.AAC.6